jgi:hypothetical protein
MSSLTKINANRANAKLSTGPKSKIGRLRASRNARRHGLSVSVLLDPRLAQEVKSLALQLSNGLENLGTADGAYCLAETEIDLRRIRKIRYELLQKLRDHRPSAEAYRNSNGESSVSDSSGLIREMSLIDRYERRALARRKSAIRRFVALVEVNSDKAFEIWQNEAKKINDFSEVVTNTTERNGRST